MTTNNKAPKLNTQQRKKLAELEEAADYTTVEPIPLPKAVIPITWSPEQALCVMEFFHSIAEEIWNWYEDDIFIQWDQNRKNSTPLNLKDTDEEIPF